MKHRPHQDFDWRAKLGHALVGADEAFNQIRSGDRIGIALAQSTPQALCGALAARLGDLENVTVCHPAAYFDWNLPGLGERFKLRSCYLSPLDRPIYHGGGIDFVPIGFYRAGVLPPGLDDFNVYLMKVSPPNRDGYVSLGESQIMSKLTARQADLVIAEIDEGAIWTGGDNTIHISEIDYFVEPSHIAPRVMPPAPSAEEERMVSTICQLVARELIPDRATIQVGVGTTSGMLMGALGGHHDLGIATEIIPRGTATLVHAGVVSGKYKTNMPGIVTGSGFSPATTQEELELAHGDMRFHLYDFNFTDDVRQIAREEGLIAVNNALTVDFGGQTGSESIGARMHTGTGGQSAFAIGAALAGGKSIIVLPSSSIVAGQRVSRIMPELALGTVVTAPRTCVHYVVTEYGIADLRGKSLTRRAHELIAIAHPDFRSELSDQARRLYA
jgi:4-hydroxybutyrate CoA-transferase